MCGGYFEDLADDSIDWDKIYREIAQELLENKNVAINANLHLKTAEKLMSAINKASAEMKIPEESKSQLASYLQKNIYAFSAAKSFTQMQYYRDMMIGEDGNIIGVGSYIKRIANEGEVFNKKYLEAEYENAYYSAIMAEQWDRYGDEQLLQYTTVGDRHVRESHRILDRHTAKKSDPFWKTNYPPNGWSCRCSVVPGNENYVNKLTDQEAGRQLKAENRDSPFWNNVGESKVIFKDNHPYFRNANGKETNLSWEQYGMQTLEKIRVNELPQYVNKSRADFDAWWKQYADKESGHISFKDVLGNEVKFENFDKGKDFKNHILQKEKDKRFEYASELQSILKNPDEVWMNPKDGNTLSYLKYYENGTIRVVVNKEMKGETMYLIEKDNPSEKNKIGESRKGVLMYK